MRPIVAALRSRDLKRLRKMVSEDASALKSAAPVVEAGRLAWREAFELFHRHGADLNAPYRGYRALHALIQEQPHGEAEQPEPERLECLRWLLEHGADPEETGAWPPARAILLAAFTGIGAYVDALKAGGAEINGFVHAALGNRRQVEKAIQKDTAFPAARDVGGLTALQCAAASRMPTSGRVEVARLLIDAGADVNAPTRSWSHDVDAIYFASGSDQRDVFQLLLERGAEPNSALTSAMWRKQFDLAEMALRHGAHPDRAIHEGKPLLNQLIRWGQIEPALWLLARGASPNVADERGWTAVHQAASRGNERALKAVLKAGSDRTRRNRDDDTPYDVAEVAGRAKILALLK